MRFHRPLALALLVFCGCRSGSSEAGRSQPGVAADTVAARAEGRLDTAEAGVEFEAPRLIPGMLAMVGAVEDSAGRVGEGMATGYKQAAGRLVDAMLTDLNRVGVGDTGGFRGMGDSLGDMLGGGTGVPEAGPEDIRRSADLLRRMIKSYQERMSAGRS